MREKELRLALVCYGGVSLAVYMHGVTKELWKLLRASRAYQDGDRASLSDSELVYHDLLSAIGDHGLELQVIADIVAGSSAGGINAVFLAHAIATGQSFDALTKLWMEEADIDRLLDPQAAPNSRWSKVYAEPLVWFAGRRYAELFADVEPRVRDEVRGKLSRLIRSRWFEPPFSGAAFTRMILDAFQALAAAPPGPALIPPGLPLDLIVTVTDFHGHPERLRLNSPGETVETEYRLVLDFHSGEGCERRLGDTAELALAARATASIPGVFPAFQLPELDAALAERAHPWPGRAAFVRRLFPDRVARGEDTDLAALVDGGVLDNAPFRPAIAALRGRPANREVDRRVLFIDPTPGKSAIRLRRDSGVGAPGFFTNIFRSLSDIPREQPIRDSLDALHAISTRTKRLAYVVDGMRGAVEAAIESAFGASLGEAALTPDRLSSLRAGAHTLSARGSGFAYPAYGQLKLSVVVESVAAWLIAAGDHDAPGGAGVARVRDAIWAQIRASGATTVDTPGEPGADQVPYVTFLRRFDLSFRIRRLRALIRAMNDLAATRPPGIARDALEAVKLELYALLSPFLQLAGPDWPASVIAAARGADTNPVPALDALADALDLTRTDAIVDAGLIRVLAPLPEPIRRAALLAYLGFPFFDIATLPLHQDDGLDETDEIKVDRIAPEDTHFLRPGAETLKGTLLNSFGAFFARAWRENDYLWGRLQAAERLIDIALSSLPPDTPPPPGLADRLKRKAMRAILAAEAGKLTSVGELIGALGAGLDAAEPNSAVDTWTADRQT